MIHTPVGSNWMFYFIHCPVKKVWMSRFTSLKCPYLSIILNDSLFEGSPLFNYQAPWIKWKHNLHRTHIFTILSEKNHGIKVHAPFNSNWIFYPIHCPLKQVWMGTVTQLYPHFFIYLLHNTMEVYILPWYTLNCEVENIVHIMN